MCRCMNGGPHILYWQRYDMKLSLIYEALGDSDWWYITTGEAFPHIRRDNLMDETVISR